MVDHFQEGDGHCEQHPNIDHLDVGGDRHALRESEKSTKIIEQIPLVCIIYLHGRQGQHDSDVDLNDHIDVFFSKEADGEADDNQQHGGDEHGEQIVNNRSPKGDFHCDGIFFIDG